jgi:Zn-dependent peptidase ImmA (M78 family)
MKNEFATFGQAERFQISLRWIEDDEPPARRPAEYGWSMGHFEILVAGVNLTASRLGTDRQEHVGWYLGPMLRWLAENWVALLHEERFGWSTKDAAPAAIACRRALELWAGAEDETERYNFLAAQEWYFRHGLRTAAGGGLFPDLFIRRVADDIELSWTGDPPSFAPDDLAFESGAGCAHLAVKDVAEPLWALLRWVATQPPSIDPAYRKDWVALCDRIDDVEHLSAEAFEAAVVANNLLARIRESFASAGRKDLVAETIPEGQHFVSAFSPAVAMFGGLTPNLSGGDIMALRDTLIAVAGGADSASLSELVRDRCDRAVGRVPHDDGYGFASEFLDDLTDTFGDYAPEGYIDIRRICRWLEVDVNEERLDTESIRGVAIAGDGFSPKILVNLASPFNLAEDGRRFTIAHELGHILFDRTRARRIAHSSGPWAAPSIEKRANAFAAYFLMPPHLIRRYLTTSDEINEGDIRSLAQRLHVSDTALVEHLYNVDFIDETERERLRPLFRHH